MIHENRLLIAALAGISVFGLSFGLLYPLMALRLEAEGYSPSYIGIVAAMQPLGLVLSNFMLPTVSARIGFGNLLKLCIFIITIIFASYPFFQPTPYWFILRFVHGAVASSLYVISEALIIKLTTEDNRIKIMAIYTALMQTTFGVGPLLLMVVGVDNPSGFLLGGFITFIGGMVMLWGGASSAVLDDGSKRSSFFSVLWNLKVLLIGFSVFAFSDAATADLLPVYAKKLEFSTSESAALLAVFLFGRTLLQVPLSLAFQKVRDELQVSISILGVCICFIAVIFSWNSFFVWPFVAVAGALTSAINTVALAILGKRLSGSDLMSGTASFTTVWGITALLATPIAGAGMDLFGPQALPASIALVAITAFGLSQIVRSAEKR